MTRFLLNLCNRHGWIIPLILLGMGMPSTMAGQTNDVGMVTQIKGAVTFQAPGQSVDTVKAFMKVRKGDRFVIPENGRVQIVYFTNGRKETWTGPAIFDVDQSRGNPVEATTPAVKPQVTSMPAVAADGIRMVRQDLDQLQRAGASLVRARKTDAHMEIPPSEELLPEEKQAIVQAKKTYNSMLKSSPPDDITPELYLYNVYADKFQFKEMVELIQIMKKKQPDNQEIDTLLQWIYSQK